MRVPDLTAVRAIWAGWVFCYHLSLQTGLSRAGYAGDILRHGYLGVDGFFVLSGMVLTLAHPRVAWREAPAFWAKRLRRIYPVHATMLLSLLSLLCVAATLGVTPHDPGRFSAREFVLHATLLQGWGLSRQWAWNYPSWSISTEWAGYITFPALVWAAARVPAGARLPLAALILVVILSLVDAGAGIGLNLTVSGALGRFFPEFAAGCLLATAPVQGAAGRYAWAMLAAIPLACLAPLPDAAIVFAQAAAMTLMLARRRAGATPVFGPALSWLGVRSFAFYMSFATAEIVLAAVFRAGKISPEDAPAPYAVAMTVCTAALAAALHRWVERPWQSARARDRQSLPAMTERA